MSFRNEESSQERKKEVSVTIIDEPTIIPTSLAPSIKSVPIQVAWQDLSFSIQTPLEKHKKEVVSGPRDIQHQDSIQSGSSHAEGNCLFSLKRNSKYERVIIHKVSGVANPGELLAVMGPSGCGKSTLLDLLMKSKNKQGTVSGTILLNGHSIDKYQQHLHRLMAYVMQDDVLVETLTLYETLWIAAELKLPKSMSKKEKEQRVQQVIEELGLENCKHTKVGGQMVRGLSGGEKRRLGIGIELLASPSVLLLDEPTSGLSSTDALTVMTTIKRLAMNHRTIIVTIHQPRSEIFESFDKILLLSQGKTVYYGKATEAAEYFKQLDYQCPFGWNVADFLLDLISLETQMQRLHNSKESNSTAINTLLLKYKIDATDSTQELKSDNQVMPSSFETAYLNYSKTEKALINLEWSQLQAMKKTIPHYALQTHDVAGFWKQLCILAHRNFLHYWRHPAIFWSQFAIHILFAVISGSLFSQLKEKKLGDIEYNVGILLFWNSQFCALMTFSAIPQLILERSLFLRESRSGLYNTSSYFIAKTLIELIFFSITTISYTSIVYFWVGLKAEGFFYALVCIVLFVNVSLSSIAAIGAGAANVDIGMAFVSLINTLNFLFCGFFIPSDSLPSGWKWFYYLAHYQYSFSGLAINEFEGRSPETLKYFDVDAENLSKWDRIYILLAFIVGYRLIGYLVLLIQKR